MCQRMDGLDYNQPFWVIACYDSEGYHSSVVASTQEDVLVKATKRSQIKSMVACSTPFVGKWSQSGETNVPDVTLPDEWKLVLGFMDGKVEK